MLQAGEEAEDRGGIDNGPRVGSIPTHYVQGPGG